MKIDSQASNKSQNRPKSDVIMRATFPVGIGCSATFWNDGKGFLGHRFCDAYPGGSGSSTAATATGGGAWAAMPAGAGPGGGGGGAPLTAAVEARDGVDDGVTDDDGGGGADPALDGASASQLRTRGRAPPPFSAAGAALGAAPTALPLGLASASPEAASVASPLILNRLDSH